MARRWALLSSMPPPLSQACSPIHPLQAPHLWKRATVVLHAHVMRTLLADAIARRRLVLLTPGEVTAAICRWQGAGLSVATISGRWLVLRSAVSWAVAEDIMRSNPLVGMRGPARPQPRRHHTLGEVRQVLAFVEANAARTMGALAADWESGTLRRSAFIAEQDHLLVRLAADSGADAGSWQCSATRTSTGAC